MDAVLIIISYIILKFLAKTMITDVVEIYKLYKENKELKKELHDKLIEKVNKSEVEE